MVCFSQVPRSVLSEMGRRGNAMRKTRSGNPYGNRKLSDYEVVEIRTSTQHPLRLAARFQLDVSTVYAIRRGDRYKDVVA